MKKRLILIIVVLLVYGFYSEQDLPIPSFSQPTQDSDNTLQTAFNNRQSGVQVQAKGVVTRILADDNQGARHQRILVRLNSGQTLLIAHNIDLAPRINQLVEGDEVAFFGEYEWNSKGGVIHWTHHDPANRHVGGWLKHRGKTYQ